MPRKLLFKMMLMTGLSISVAVISSWMFIRIEPSPVKFTTMLSGIAFLAPKAAGRP